MMSLVHDGVARGKLSLERMVRVLCENPARIFGLFPRKGTLRPGSDADLVVFDPSARVRIEHRTQHSRASYTAYEGREVVGVPVLTMQRGRILVERGERPCGRRAGALPGDEGRTRQPGRPRLVGEQGGQRGEAIEEGHPAC